MAYSRASWTPVLKSGAKFSAKIIFHLKLTCHLIYFGRGDWITPQGLAIIEATIPPPSTPTIKLISPLHQNQYHHLTPTQPKPYFNPACDVSICFNKKELGTEFFKCWSITKFLILSVLMKISTSHPLLFLVNLISFQNTITKSKLCKKQYSHNCIC